MIEKIAITLSPRNRSGLVIDQASSITGRPQLIKLSNGSGKNFYLLSYNRLGRAGPGWGAARLEILVRADFFCQSETFSVYFGREAAWSCPVIKWHDH